jgi:hypothetical protein
VSRDPRLAAQGYCACEIILPGDADRLGWHRFACNLIDGHAGDHAERFTLVDDAGYRLPCELRWHQLAHQPDAALVDP